MGAYNKIVLSETDNSFLNNVSNETVSKEMQKFNNSYNADKVKDIFDAYENVSVYDLKDNAVVKANAMPYVAQSVSLKQKLVIVGAIMICAIMAFMAIFNLFVINQTNKDINILQDNIASEEKTYYDLYNDWNKATDAAGIKTDLSASGYTLTSADEIISVELGEVTAVEDLKGSTNWFDSFCNFIKSIF